LGTLAGALIIQLRRLPLLKVFEDLILMHWLNVYLDTNYIETQTQRTKFPSHKKYGCASFLTEHKSNWEDYCVETDSFLVHLLQHTINFNLQVLYDLITFLRNFLKSSERQKNDDYFLSPFNFKLLSKNIDFRIVNATFQLSMQFNFLSTILSKIFKQNLTPCPVPGAG
jgi:hypothetical protein